MKEQKNIKIKSNLMDEIIRSRRGKVNLKYFSPNLNPRTKFQNRNVVLNKNNIKELSKLSDRPILVNKYNQNSRRDYISVDKIDISNEYNSSFNNNNILKCRELNYKKNIVIFTECPKKQKISDYILKSNKKKKLYKLTYLEENDLNYDKPINEIMSQNYNYNIENNLRVLPKRKHIYNLNTDDSQNGFENDMYINRFSNNKNNRRNNYNMRNLYTNNQNNDQLKVIKIQSVWRGYQIRRFLVNRLNIFYNIVRIYNCLYNTFYNQSKPFFKIFLSLLKKIKNIGMHNKIKLDNNKRNNNKKIININKNISNPYKKNIKKINIIEKKNINVFVPGEKTKIENENKFIYKRKINSPKNSSSLINKNSIKSNVRENNFISKEKGEYSDRFTNINFKKKLKLEMSNIINKKNILLYGPLFLYRLKILYKIKVTEHKYKCLFNIIKIKKRKILSLYFNKYKNNIFSNNINKMILQNKTNAKHNKQNLDFINNEPNNLNKNNNNPINNQKNLINNNENHNKINLNNNEINANNSNNNLRNRNNKSTFLIKYKSSALSGKKLIRVKKIKGMNSNYFSQTKSLNSGKVLMNSFDSDNINVRKMRIKKVNILSESNEIKNKLTQEFIIKNKNSQFLENSYFIQKIASISSKISNKNNLYTCFNFWKKKSKKK